MIRRSVAGLVLGVSVLLASLSWTGYLALRTVLEPARSRDVAEELLDNAQVRDQLASNVASALSAAIPADVPIEKATIEAAAAGVIADPAFERLVLSAFVETHAAFLGEGEAPEDLDLTPLAEGARQSIIAAAPQFADRIPPTPELKVDLPTERIPNADPLRSLLRKVVPILAIAALAGAVFALFTTTDRPSVLRRAGSWAIGATAFYLLIGLGLPWLLRRFSPDNSEVVAALLTAFLRSVVTPSIALGVVGAVLIALSLLWPAMGDRGARAPRGAAPRDDRQSPSRGSSPPVPARARVDPMPPGPTTYAAAPPRRSAPAPTARAPYPDQVARAPYPDQAARAPYPDQVARAPYPDQVARAPYPDQVVPAPPTAPSHSVFADAGPPVADGFRDVGVAPGPRWRDGLGWVLDPSDPRPPPENARWVDGVGYVVPGPPPGQL